ncbi:MAG: hypothetical protein F4X64_07035 [Chloroflexi bacterium]|nr:hypothetical protein [Chloroflexota bacterium]
MTGRFNWDWSDEGPPEEAYSRVTEPERFAPLHDWALDTVAGLERYYEITRVEGIGLDHDLERSQISRPTVKLTPLHESGAPVTIVFTDFPGLAVRTGRWFTDWFPSCGCDACDEMPDGVFQEFMELVRCVVSSGFRESLYLSRRGDGWRTSEFRSDEYSRSGESRVPRSEAIHILNGQDEIVFRWAPWQTKSKS